MHLSRVNTSVVAIASMVAIAACGSEDAPSTPTAPTTPPPATNQAPTASIGASATQGSAPIGITFDGSASADSDGQVRSYSWTFGDGSSATGETATHVYESTGSFTVTLTVTDDDGAQGSATTTVTVAEPTADQIFGVTWFDENRDGQRQASEPGASGIPVFIDANANGTLDAGETSVTSGVGGIYRFEGLSAGNYTVVQSLPFGWTNSFPGPGVTTTPAPRSSLPLQAARIIEGEAANSGEFPFQVSLMASGISNPTTAHFCGGTLVAPGWVLTASHCLVDFSASSVDVYVGSNDLTSGGQRIPAKALYVHPFYVDGSDSFKRDVGLIELETRVEDLPRAFLIDESIYDDIVRPFETATVIGWGRTGADVVGSIPELLQKVEIPVLSDFECTTRYGDAFDTSMICAGFLAGGKSSCQGDSGGPLLFDYQGQWYEAGVVSWGVGCALPERPGVYARIAAMWDFLADNIPQEPSGAFTVSLEGQAVRADFGNGH